MPPFGPAYSDAELAAVANYVIERWRQDGSRHARGCRQVETGIAQEGGVFRLIFQSDQPCPLGLYFAALQFARFAACRFCVTAVVVMVFVVVAVLVVAVDP